MRQLLIDTGIPQGSATASKPIGPFPNLAKAILQLGIGATDCNGNGVPDECESPIGACCVGTTCTVVVAQTCCSSQGGAFIGVGSTCADCDGNGVPDVCQIILELPGACCLSEEQCINGVTRCACSDSGGWFLGPGSVCPESCGIIPSGPSQVPPEP